MKPTEQSKLVLRISLLLYLVSAVVVSLEVFSYLKQEKQRKVKAKNNRMHRFIIEKMEKYRAKEKKRQE